MFANACFGQSPDARMDNRLELFARFRIVKDECSKLLPVESLVSLEYLAAKSIDDLIPTIMTGGDDLTGQRVGINNGRTEIFQNFRYGTFARCDAACQSDEFHATVITKSLEAFKQKF